MRILTNDPVFNEIQGKVDIFGSGSRGGGDNYGVKAAVNVPLLEDRLALRLVATTETYDGWLEEPISAQENVNDREVETLRAKLRFAPTDNVELVVGVASYDNANDSSNQSNDDGNYIKHACAGRAGRHRPAIRTGQRHSDDRHAMVRYRQFDLVFSTSNRKGQGRTRSCAPRIPSPRSCGSAPTTSAHGM